MPTLAESYLTKANELLAQAWTVNTPVIAKLAPILGASVARGEIIHTFGSGHSEIIAREIVGRAGGLVNHGALHLAGRGWGRWAEVGGRVFGVSVG